MAYEIYWIAASPYSWRALLALEIKGVDYESRLLQASKKEHETPEFLQLNPRGKVPVLKNGDKIIYESIAILTHLDRMYPEPPLFGATADEADHIWQTIFEIENYIREPVFAIVRPVYFNHVADSMTEIKEAAKTVEKEFKLIDRLLASENYLNGDKISAADVTLFPLVMSLYRALSLKAGAVLDLGYLLYDDDYPNISNWVKHIEAIPGYEKTYPPNWRE